MSKKHWRLSEAAFRRLLEWLDNGVDSEGQTYLEIRRRLAAYFDRKNCPAPDDLADETLNRVARRLEEEGNITGDVPARYCYIVAKFVLLEKRNERDPVSMEALSNESRGRALRATEDTGDDREHTEERRLECLEDCLERLDGLDRQLIHDYHYGDPGARIENRRMLAARLGITANALAIRTCRIRNRLEICVRQCTERAEQSSARRTRTAQSLDIPKGPSNFLLSLRRSVRGRD
jgi:hypothetical protein